MINEALWFAKPARREQEGDAHLKPSHDITIPPREAVTPVGINHLVLNVRNIEESHAFWTEIVGFTQVGELHPGPDRPDPPKMRFYSGDHGGKLNHHDLALMEMPNLPQPSPWGMADSTLAINHVAIMLPSRDAWIRQLAFLQSKGVKFRERTNHGMTHSVYISDPNGYGVELLYELPRAVWEGDIDAALNYAERLPTEGDEALVDEEDDVPVFRESISAVPSSLTGLSDSKSALR
jgi:catechol 2,3-dioxygenase